MGTSPFENSKLNPLFGAAMRHIGYIRVSTDLQDVGIEVQREAIIRYAAVVLKAEIQEFHIDQNISGSLPFDKRPALKYMLETIHEGDVIIVQKRDRLGRDTFLNRDIEDVIDYKGARVVSTLGEGMDSNSAESKLMRLIFDAFSTYEREITSERIKKGMKIKSDRGEQVGSIRYGQKLGEDGKRLIPHEEEVAIMNQIMNMKNQNMSQRKIAAELNRQGISMRGTTWKQAQLGLVIKIALNQHVTSWQKLKNASASRRQRITPTGGRVMKPILTGAL